MNLWIDDLRLPPPGWVWVKTPQAAIAVLEEGQVKVVSFDHDLGLDAQGEIMEAYPILCWLEERVMMGMLLPPEVRIHTDNAGARPKMQQAAYRISQGADPRFSTAR